MTDAAQVAADLGGAFVEVDEHKLNREQMYLLGAQHTIEQLLEEIQGAAEYARQPDCPNPFMAKALENIVPLFKARRDQISMALTRSAVKTKAATLHNAFGKRVE